MDEGIFTPKQLSQILGVSKETLRKWYEEGTLQGSVTKGGHHRYKYLAKDVQPNNTSGKRCIIYARVSSAKQKNDLERQVAMLQKDYPHYEVIQDIGSGINFKRIGLQRLLEGVFKGEVSNVVVAHRDRLSRFGYDLFDFIFRYFNTFLQVHGDQEFKEPSRELADDLLSIITVFTTRYYGSRKYKVLSKDKNLSQSKTKFVVQPMHRRLKILLQPNNLLPEFSKGEG